MALLSDADSRRIEDAIVRIEQRSAAEFVVAVVPRCARYDRGRALVAASWAVASAVGYFQFVPWGGETVGLLLELPVFALVWAVLGTPSLERLLVPPNEAEHAVRAAAFRLFAEHGIHRTKGRTGMLLLVSELERRAVLLGDSGIHERIGDAGWSEHVEKLVGRIRDGRTADGVIEVLESLEARLAAGVPPEPNDENELSNEVIRDA